MDTNCCNCRHRHCTCDWYLASNDDFVCFAESPEQDPISGRLHWNRCTTIRKNLKGLPCPNFITEEEYEEKKAREKKKKVIDFFKKIFDF